MSTYTQIYYHIEFSTKARKMCLNRDRKEELYRYIWGVLKNKRCHLYRINGMEDHIHILTSLHPTICLSDLVKDIKVSSSKWIKKNGIFSNFSSWQDGYGAFTENEKAKERLIDYIKSQEHHHNKVNFIDEYKALLLEAGVEFNEDYLL